MLFSVSFRVRSVFAAVLGVWLAHCKLSSSYCGTAGAWGKAYDEDCVLRASMMRKVESQVETFLQDCALWSVRVLPAPSAISQLPYSINSNAFMLNLRLSPS